MKVTFYLYGEVTEERFQAEAKIAEHRLEQLK